MAIRHSKSRGGRVSKSQENVNQGAHSVFCIAASLLKSVATDCTASNSQ